MSKKPDDGIYIRSRVDLEFKAKVEAFAVSIDRNESWIVEKATEEYLAREEKKLSSEKRKELERLSLECIAKQIAKLRARHKRGGRH